MSYRQTISLYFCYVYVSCSYVKRLKQDHCIDSRSHLNPRRALFHFTTRPISKSSSQVWEVKALFNNLTFSKADYTDREVPSARCMAYKSRTSFICYWYIFISSFQLFLLWLMCALLDPCTITFGGRIVAVVYCFLNIEKCVGMKWRALGSPCGNRGLDEDTFSYCSYISIFTSCYQTSTAESFHRL